MNENRTLVILMDVPVFPKGVLALSLLSVAACFPAPYRVSIVDLNITRFDQWQLPQEPVAMYGLKVSSQNAEIAIDISRRLREKGNLAKIVWGGELPSLMPEFCLQHADTIVSGLFEHIADDFVRDLATGSLQANYISQKRDSDPSANIQFSLIPDIDRYYSFMGYPLETSRGCTEKCTFCMVHVMQKDDYHTTHAARIETYIGQYRNKYINVIDYNFGVDAEHVIEMAKVIKDSGALGWMAEMCIELLDNDLVLTALRDSRCRIIYCGLEAIDQQSLNSVHKMNTNHIQNYERIIRKAQLYGIQIAAGIILGIEGTHDGTFDELFDFYQRMGIIYAKLTFLIYNPGTKVQKYMRKKGDFVTEDIMAYDGQQLSYLPHGVDQNYVLKGTEDFIRSYYSLKGIVSRSFNSKISLVGKAEFILFNLLYRKVYQDWLRFDTLHHPENIKGLINKPFSKSTSTQMLENLLGFVRRMRMIM